MPADKPPGGRVNNPGFNNPVKKIQKRIDDQNTREVVPVV